MNGFWLVARQSIRVQLLKSFDAEFWPKALIGPSMCLAQHSASVF